MNKYLETAKILSTHALKGEVKIELWCDNINFIASLKHLYLYNNGNGKLTLEKARPYKQNAIIKFIEINDIQEAEKIVGKILYCNRNDVKLESGQYFLDDFIGCKIIDIDSNQLYGTVSSIDNFGASNILNIQFEGKKYMIPLIDDIIKEKDFENGVIRIKYMKGLLDEN